MAEMCAEIADMLASIVVSILLLGDIAIPKSTATLTILKPLENITAVPR